MALVLTLAVGTATTTAAFALAEAVFPIGRASRVDPRTVLVKK